MDEAIDAITGSFVDKIVSSGQGLVNSAVSSAVNQVSSEVNSVIDQVVGGVNMTTVNGVNTYIISNAVNQNGQIQTLDTPPKQEERYKLERSDALNYIASFLPLIQSELNDNALAKKYLESETTAYQNTFNSYQQVAICYENKVKDQQLSKTDSRKYLWQMYPNQIPTYSYPEIIPQTIRVRAGELNSNLLNLKSIKDKAEKSEKDVDSYIKEMASALHYNVLEYYRNKIGYIIDSEYLLDDGKWGSRDYENKNSNDGIIENALFSKLSKEASETLSKIVTTGSGENETSSDVSPLAACRGLQAVPVEPVSNNDGGGNGSN
jgi:hypothetical protein